jgi:hypothetical protein
LVVGYTRCRQECNSFIFFYKSINFYISLYQAGETKTFSVFYPKRLSFMRKIFCFAALLGFVNLAFAQQNSSPWPTTGNVGIGTAAPAEQLEVSNPTTSAIRISSLKTQLLSNDVIGRLDFYKADASTGGGGVATSIQSRSFDLGGAFDMDFVTGSISTPVNAMTLHWNGNVGIGTNSPVYRLTVQSGAVSTFPLSVLASDGSYLAGVGEDANGAGNFQVRSASGVAQVYLNA